MILKRLLNSINRNERNNINDNWETIEQTYTKIEETADEAKTKADDAVTTAGTAKFTAETVETKFNRIVAEAGSNNPEVVQARGDFVNLNERLNTEIGQVTEQLAETNKDLKVLMTLEDITVNVSAYGALGNGADDTQAILNAVNDLLIKPEKKVLHFPSPHYVMTQKLPKINKDFKLTGASLIGTTIEYQASEDGFFLENSSKGEVEVKDIWLKINKLNNVIKVGGMEFYKNTRSEWGKTVIFDNVKISGYNTSSIKIYAPFMTRGKGIATFGHKGLTANLINSRLPNLDMARCGLELVGYEEGVTDTFGNVNSFENCFFADNIYGVKIASVGTVVFKSCTFEPNFINIYAINPTGNSNTSNITIENSWLEDYTGVCHPDFGALVTYEFDETTGDLVQPLAKKASVKLLNTRVHPSCPLDSRMDGAFTYGTGTNYSPKGFSALESVDYNILVGACADGHFYRFGTKENYLRSLTKFKKGLSLLSASNDNASKQTELYSYSVNNPNTDKNALYTFEIPIDILVAGEMRELIIDANIYSSGGNPVWCRAKQIYVTPSKTEVLSDQFNYATSIDAENKGMKLTYNSTTKRVTVQLQAALSNSTNLQIELIRRKF